MLKEDLKYAVHGVFVSTRVLRLVPPLAESQQDRQHPEKVLPVVVIHACRIALLLEP